MFFPYRPKNVAVKTKISPFVVIKHLLAVFVDILQKHFRCHAECSTPQIAHAPIDNVQMFDHCSIKQIFMCVVFVWILKAQLFQRRSFEREHCVSEHCLASPNNNTCARTQYWYPQPRQQIKILLNKQQAILRCFRRSNIGAKTQVSTRTYSTGLALLIQNDFFLK